MYKNAPNSSQLKMDFLDFPNPFGQKLRGDNRWVRLSRLIPWDEFESPYAAAFGDCGNVAYPFRMALGAEILKERLGVTDRELVEQISENPYLQYFLGLPRYQTEAPFDASTLVHFRKRLTSEMLNTINERIARAALKSKEEPLKSEKETSPPPSSPSHPQQEKTLTMQQGQCDEKLEVETKPPQGKLLMDATCAPEDIRYPNDLSLLNEAREVTETIVDCLWESCPAHLRPDVKPRTYRKKARIAYLNAIRSRLLSTSKRRRALRFQLRCVRRNQEAIVRLSQNVSLAAIPEQLYRSMLVVSELYRQQRILLAIPRGERRSVPDRIVSVWKPHVRPIVRGKASAAVEFGAKLSISVIKGLSFVDRLSWDAYNEGGDLEGQAVAYRRRLGYWPESIHADKIYQTRNNRMWCKARNIRLSGPCLGRSPANVEERSERHKLQRQDEIDRNPVEGRFGVGKRRYNLARIMRRLKETSESAISMIFLVMNLDKILRDLLSRIFGRLWKTAIVVSSVFLGFLPTARVNAWAR